MRLRTLSTARNLFFFTLYQKILSLKDVASDAFPSGTLFKFVIICTFLVCLRKTKNLLEELQRKERSPRNKRTGKKNE